MPCVILIGSAVAVATSVGGVGGLEVEGDVLPDLERGVQLGAALGRLPEDVGALLVVVPALVARLDHRLDGDAVGGGAGGDAHRVADRAAAELQHDVLAEVVQQLVHLAGVDAARGDRHDTRHRGPVLVEVEPGLGVGLDEALSRSVS